MENRTAYDIDLWGTSSENYLKYNKFIKKLATKKNFQLITWDMINKKIENDKVKLYYNKKQFKLEVGDLICRKGHVEFYIGNNKVVNWGRIHSAYIINKFYEVELRGLRSNDNEDKEVPFTAFIRFMGGK